MNSKDPTEAIRACYSTWGCNYYDDYYTDKALYPPVHQDIIRRELQRHGSKTLLDAGCGPASILRGLVDLGMDLYGFDLTAEMISECKKVMSGHGFATDHFWSGNVTRKDDFRPPATKGKIFDAAICFGVLPHIQREMDIVVFENLRESVRPGGLVMVEARNILFALFTLNRYSFEFFESELLPLEAMKNAAGGEASNAVLKGLQGCFHMDLPPVRKGKKQEPGYDEVLSRMHNPLATRDRFSAAGFENVRILFYHFHAFPPVFEGIAPKAFRELSLGMESNPEDWRGYFMASAFILVGTRA